MVSELASDMVTRMAGSAPRKAAKRPARKTPARRSRAVPADLDELNVQGNDDLSGDVTVAVRDGVAMLKPPGFDRLDPDVRAALVDVMMLVGQRRALGREIDQAVRHLRGHGVSWGVLGWCVGLTSEGARRRWGEESE